MQFLLNLCGHVNIAMSTSINRIIYGSYNPCGIFRTKWWQEQCVGHWLFIIRSFSIVFVLHLIFTNCIASCNIFYFINFALFCALVTMGWRIVLPLYSAIRLWVKLNDDAEVVRLSMQCIVTILWLFIFEHIYTIPRWILKPINSAI